MQLPTTLATATKAPNTILLWILLMETFSQPLILDRDISKADKEWTEQKDLQANNMAMVETTCQAYSRTKVQELNLRDIEFNTKRLISCELNFKICFN